MSQIVRGRARDYAQGAYRSWAWPGVVPANKVLPVGDKLSQGPKVGNWSLANRSFVWSGNVPAPERTELYRSILTVQQRPLDIQRGFTFNGVQPADVNLVHFNPTNVFAKGRQEQFARGEAAKQVAFSGVPPTNVSAQVPLFGNNISTRHPQLTNYVNSSVTQNSIPFIFVPGGHAGVFYYQDEAERSFGQQHRSWTWRGVPIEEILLMDPVNRGVMQGNQIGDWGKGYPSFYWKGVEAQEEHVELYQNILTVQQLPLDIQRSNFLSGVMPVPFIPAAEVLHAYTMTLMQIPTIGNPSWFVDHPPIELPPGPTPVPPPVVGGGKFLSGYSRTYLDTFADIYRIIEEEKEEEEEAEQLRKQRKNKEAKQVQGQADDLVDLVREAVSSIQNSLVKSGVPVAAQPDAHISTQQYMNYIRELEVKVEQNRNKLIETDDDDVLLIIQMIAKHMK